MKRFLTSMLSMVLLLFFPLAAVANSGPVFWQGYPSTDMMSIDERTPLAVERETLVFDFNHGYKSSYSLSGRVKATYEMRNPTNETQSVQMAFPFVGSLDSLKTEEIGITSDGFVLPYEVYLGDVVNSYGDPIEEDSIVSLDFNHIVNTIKDKSYQGENFEENKIGKLYLIEVIPTGGQELNLAVDFTFDSEKTKVLTSGFNRYERSSEKTNIAAWCYEPKLLEILVLGEDINLEVNGYTDGSLGNKTDQFTYRISAQKTELKAYLMERIKEYTTLTSDSEIFDTQLYNLYAKDLDKAFARNSGYVSSEDLLSTGDYMRIIILLYTVEFPPNSIKKVDVQFTTIGTMDKTQTVEPLHSFNYILNPAKNWSDFKNLSIRIITPQKAPYVVKSSVDLTPVENNVYIANLVALPKEDLSFTLYAHEKITFLDEVKGRLKNNFGYFTPFVIGTLTLGLIALVLIVAKKKYTHYN